MTDSDDTEEKAREIIEESLEMGDRGPVESVEGQCTVCGDDAIWRNPVGDDRYGKDHAAEFFCERHG